MENMYRWAAAGFLVLVCVSQASGGGGVGKGECHYSRRGGLFLNEYLDVANENFEGASGSDTTAAVGDTATVTFTAAFNVLGATGASSTVKQIDIYDQGILVFWDDGAPSGTYVDATYTDHTTAATNPRQGYDKNKAFATARWFEDGTNLEHKFSYQHLKRSELIESGNTVKSMCTLHRIEAMLSDCDGSVTSFGVDSYTHTVSEALIVTFEHKDTANNHFAYDQVVVAVTSTGRTKIILNLAAPPASVTSTDVLAELHLTGYINGKYETASSVDGSSWQAICAGAGDVKDNSNCDCGSWNAGIYVFDVEDTNADVLIQNRECDAEISSKCAAGAYGTTPHYLQNWYCRQWAVPVDTCREDLTCEAYKTGSKDFQMVLKFRDTPPWSEAIFIDLSDWSGTNVITPMADASCKQTIATSTVTFTFTAAEAATCDIAITNTDELEFYIMVRDITATENSYVKDGYRILHGTCEFGDLPSSISAKPQFRTFPTTRIPTPDGRQVDFFVNSAYRYTTNPVDTKIPATSIVYLGQDIFLMACYEQGTRNVLENVEPYGIWVTDCYVSNDPNFPADANTVQLVDSNGCRVTGITSGEAFYLEQEFKWTSDATTRQATNAYEWCITSGKMDAARWLNIDELNFKCTIHFCVNQVARANTVVKCENACSGSTDASAADRRKRDADSVNWLNETRTVQTTVRVTSARETVEARLSDCTDPTLAVSMVAGLSMTLLLATVLGIFMFIKVQGNMGLKASQLSQ